MATSLLQLSSPPPLPPCFRRKGTLDDVVTILPVTLLGYGMHNLMRNARLGLSHLPRKGFLNQGFGISSSSGLRNLQRHRVGDASHMDGIYDFERQLQDLFDEVKIMIKMENEDDAIDLLQANYEVVKEQLDTGLRGIEQAAMLDVLALGYMAAGDFNIVEHLLEKLNEIVGSLRDGMPLVDSILLHMGSMYSTIGKFEDAMFVYGRGLEILEKEYGSQSPFVITPLLGMAKVLSLIGRPSKAIKIYHRTVEVLEMSRGAESEELVLPLFGLGNICLTEGKVTDAETCFNRIINIYTKVYGENDGKVGVAFCSLAHVKCAKGSVDQAISIYKKGLQVIKDSNYMSLDDDVLEKMRIDLAELLHATGREKEGRELLQECLLITERCKGLEHPSSVAHLVNLATSYSRSKNFVEAERLLRTSLHIMSKAANSKDHSITVPMLHLAVVLYNLKQDEEAEYLASEVLRIREQAFGTDSLLVGEALDCLVSIQTRQGKTDSDILAKLKRILTIQEKELGFESEEVITTLNKVVFYMDKMGKKNEKLPLERRLSLLRTKYKQKVPV